MIKIINSNNNNNNNNNINNLNEISKNNNYSKKKKKLKKSKKKEALEDAIKSIELDNTFPKAHFRAGKASFNLFRFEEGKRYFQNGISAIEKGIPNASLKKEFQIWIKKCESARNDPNIQKQKQLKMIEKMSQSKENNLADMKKIAEKQQNNSFVCFFIFSIFIVIFLLLFNFFNFLFLLFYFLYIIFDLFYLF